MDDWSCLPMIANAQYRIEQLEELAGDMSILAGGIEISESGTLSNRDVAGMISSFAETLYEIVDEIKGDIHD